MSPTQPRRQLSRCVTAASKGADGQSTRGRRTLPKPAWIALTCLAPLVTACEATSPMAPQLSLAPQGPAERGMTLGLQLFDGATAVPASAAEWMVTPSGHNQIVNPGQIVLADTGTVTITARTQHGSTTLTVHVAPPPTLVFDMNDVDSSGSLGNRDIYRVALDGQELVRLTGSTADNEYPTEAQGSIVFTSFRDGYPALYRVPAAGGADARLGALTMSAQQPALSSDGSRLAFIISSNGSNRVWTAAADGSGAVPATASFDPPSAEEASPSWNGTGPTLAFVSTAGGNAALAELDLASGQGRALTNGSTTDLDPAWSADGRTLAFSSTRDGDLGVFTMNVPSGQVRRLLPYPSMAGEPTWLSDGRLVYTTWSYAGPIVTSQLVWIDPLNPSVVHVIPTPAGNPEHAHELR